ncbi:uncharacterized protein BO95DRAFT_436755 [Aspergillus brunneoviolaceus CBS 621.78]|uniref:Uncharacterized protein n=1 Tax=Aspergillus brunneoviolaceus CBS 621.78 TaxID=1450534 RepID=A0ACD1FTR0_9EURO|nr:hypothetical protein BO95DRAFT_436755 [Aspergillus brunneoviolaceus CBS 621.78]RAH40354.1 hypothetical protein BO95DRAFT_436755 [Aspergillus brunneoviolaceus CBS 621.78]
MQLKTIFGVLALASLGLTSPTPNPDVEGFEERDLEERQFGIQKPYCCKQKIDTKDWVILWIKVAGVGIDCVQTTSCPGGQYKYKCKSNFPLDVSLPLFSLYLYLYQTVGRIDRLILG